MKRIQLWYTKFKSHLTNSIQLKIDEEATIPYSYQPDNTDLVRYSTWTSSDTSVVTVDNGAITAVAIGEATITASRTIGEVVVSRTCTVTVIDSVAIDSIVAE